MDVNPTGSASFPTGLDQLLAAAEQPETLSGPPVPTERPTYISDTEASAPSDGATSRAGGSTAATTPPLAQAARRVFAPGIAVSVSYQVVHNHQEIVTVFKDAATGQVVNQVPPEILLRLAAFFDQMAGGLVDSNA